MRAPCRGKVHRCAPSPAKITCALSKGMADPVRARMTRSLHWAKETTFTSDDILATHTAVDSSIRIETFRNMKVTADDVNKMLETVSFSLDTLSGQKLPTGYADFEFLRDHPYFLQNGETFCLDYEFALGKRRASTHKGYREIWEN